MKKIFILSIVILINFSSFAQRVGAVHSLPLNVIDQHSYTGTKPAARTTTTGDTLKLSHIADTLALTVYSLGADSGYVTGTDYWGDQAFAERYDVSDSSRNMQVVGLFALFGGKVNPASAKTITFSIWNQGAPQFITGSKFYNGFPNNVLDTVTVPITHLGIGPVSDTLKKFFFPIPTGNLTSFFIGYTINYSFNTLNGDTIGLASTLNGFRKPSTMYTISFNVSDFGDTTLDTMVNVQNATLGSDNTWYDNYTQDDSLLNNLAIYPIVITGFPTSAKGITRNNLTFYGNYPNPSVSSTNIKFALASGADVTLQVMDMNGRVLNTIKQTGLAAGGHTIPINTSTLPAGDYLYLIRTSSGDGIAGKMTVTR